MPLIFCIAGGRAWVEHILGPPPHRPAPRGAGLQHPVDDLVDHGAAYRELIEHLHRVLDGLGAGAAPETWDAQPGFGSRLTPAEALEWRITSLASKALGEVRDAEFAQRKAEASRLQVLEGVRDVVAGRYVLPIDPEADTVLRLLGTKLAVLDEAEFGALALLEQTLEALAPRATCELESCDARGLTDRILCHLAERHPSRAASAHSVEPTPPALGSDLGRQQVPSAWEDVLGCDRDGPEVDDDAE